MCGCSADIRCFGSWTCGRPKQNILWERSSARSIFLQFTFPSFSQVPFYHPAWIRSKTVGWIGHLVPWPEFELVVRKANLTPRHDEKERCVKGISRLNTDRAGRDVYKSKLSGSGTLGLPGTADNNVPVLVSTCLYLIPHSPLVFNLKGMGHHLKGSRPYIFHDSQRVNKDLTNSFKE